MRPIYVLIAAIAVLALPAAASAGEVKVAGGILTYTDVSANARNAVAILIDPSSIKLYETGTTTSGTRIQATSDGSCSISRRTATCPRTGVTSIQVAVGPQNDAVSIGGGLPALLDGGDGNDSLRGGDGDDTLVGGAGADVLKGGGRNDRADYSARVAPLSISADDNADDGEPGESDNVASDVESLTGGAAADTLVGNDAANALEGGPGDDTLDGRGGADLLQGGDGTDTASYSTHSGVRVTLDGKPNDGAVGENDGVNTENVIGSPGDDVLIGDAVPNVLNAGAGNDRLLPGSAEDTVDAGPGDDIVQTLDGAKDLVACGDGEDGVVTDRADVRSDCDYIKYRVLAATDTSVRQADGAVRIPARCSPATVLGCSGSARITVGRSVLGARRVRLAPGRRTVVRIKLSRKGRAVLRRKRLTTATLVVRDRDAAGVLTVTKQTIRIAR